MPARPDDDPALDDATLTALLEVLRDVSGHLGATHHAFVEREAAVYDTYRTTGRLFSQVLLRVSPAGRRVVPVFPDQVDEVDLRVLAALDSGVKREQIGQHAGIPRQESYDRVRALNDATGTETLFQLARAATSRLWIPADPGAPRLPGPRG